MLIATFRIEHGALALERAFEDLPGMVLEAERIAAHSTTWTMPCVWVAATDFDAVDDALAGDPTVERIVETDEFDGETYYHLEWADEVIERVTEYVDQQGSLLMAKATDRGWEVQFRFVEREQFDAFRALLAERDHSFELLELFDPGAPRQTMGEVTPPQHRALVAATERGYYRVPREITGGELAEALEMSQQSLSELLRRGTENLVRATLVTDRGAIDP